MGTVFFTLCAEANRRELDYGSNPNRILRKKKTAFAVFFWWRLLDSNQ